MRKSSRVLIGIGASVACALAAALQASPARQSQAPPDRVFVNALVWTGDAARPSAEAIAVTGDRVSAIGTSAAMRALAGGATEIVDLGGRRVVPGFNDAHWHLPSRRTADLSYAGGVDAIVSRLREFEMTLPEGAWLTGRGWTPSDFPANAAHRRYLDAAFPRRPVYITDRDGHQALANGAALDRAGVSRETTDPQGGRVERDADGSPSGLLKEAASSLVGRHVPPPSADEIYASILEELDKAARLGLTSVQIASGRASGATFEALQRALAQGALPVRVRSAVPFTADVTDAQLAEYVALRDAHRGRMLTFGVAKGMLDGTVDAHTAAMLEPYANSDDTGLPMWTAGDLARAVTRYDAAGLQIQLHAIGDRAIRMALDAYEVAARANGTAGARHRIEHIEVPARDDLPRFATLGVIASTQAMFASPDVTTLQNYAPALGPERARRSNAFKLFDDARAVQAFGSDYPVFTMDVLRGLHAAVTRELPDGTPKGGWHPEHRLSLDAALRHYTWGSAYASFDEADKGTLVPGTLADFVVLTEDIFEHPAARLLTARIAMTVVGGRTIIDAASR